MWVIFYSNDVIENTLCPYITSSALVNTEMNTLVSLIKFILLLTKHVHSVFVEKAK